MLEFEYQRRTKHKIPTFRVTACRLTDRNKYRNQSTHYCSFFPQNYPNRHTANVYSCPLPLTQTHSACPVQLHNSTAHLLYKCCTNSKGLNQQTQVMTIYNNCSKNSLLVLVLAFISRRLEYIGCLELYFKGLGGPAVLKG